MHHTLASLKQATPYIRLYKGATFVVKVGGAMLAEAAALEGIVEQVALLYQLGIRVVIVHGGGPQATALAERLGVETTVVAGRRVTDDETLEITKMVGAGALNVEILAACIRQHLPAVGMSGVDALTVRAHKRPETEITDDDGNTQTVDFGWVGDIDRVDGALIRHMLDGKFMPVIASLGADEEGQVFNINADTVAAHIAAGVGAEKLIVVGDTSGLLADPELPGSVVSFCDLADLEQLESSGAVTGGMRPKLAAARFALTHDVPRVHLVSGVTEDGVLREIFTNEGSGTLIVAAKAVASSE